jgi:hypothetical protein
LNFPSLNKSFPLVASQIVDETCEPEGVTSIAEPATKMTPQDAKPEIDASRSAVLLAISSMQMSIDWPD